MNFAQLRAFHAVAEEGGFTRAATRLGLTQPTLSGQVKALENDHGVRLFERRGRGVVLTEPGRALLEVTRRLFDLEAEAERLLSGARGLGRGSLSVGADAPYHVVPLLAAFSRRYPGIELKLSFGNTQAVLRQLFERRCDVAVLPELKADARLHARAFHRERILVFVDRGHRLASQSSVRLKELNGERLILREVGSTTRALFEAALARAGVPARAALEVGSREAVREAVAAGLGVGAVFESEFGEDERLHALAVRDAGMSATEYAACLATRRDTPVVQAFFELLPESP